MVWDGLGCDGGWSAVGVSRRAGCASLGASSLPPPCLSALGHTELSAQMCLSRGRSEGPETQGWMPLSDHDAAAPHTRVPSRATTRSRARARGRACGMAAETGQGREKGGRHILVFSWAWPNYPGIREQSMEKARRACGARPKRRDWPFPATSSAAEASSNKGEGNG